jgi:ABC-type branched-subunit amino acid transport system substrate-binding protein
VKVDGRRVVKQQGDPVSAPDASAAQPVGQGVGPSFPLAESQLTPTVDPDSGPVRKPARPVPKVVADRPHSDHPVTDAYVSTLPAMPAADPILVGVLYDFPQHDGGASFEAAVRLGLDSGQLDRRIELHPVQANGLPAGTAHAIGQAFRELDDAGVLAIVGPSISDNGLIVRELADQCRVPCINYTGGEFTRSDWMFHYQVGSLDEEPVLLAQHLAERGLSTVAVVHDDTPVGRRYLDAFVTAAADAHVDLVATASVSAVSTDLTHVVKRIQASEPDALCYLGLGVAARTVALAVREVGWRVVVVTNSALMFGYVQRDWRADWEDWTYVDTVADDNPLRSGLRATLPGSAGPVGVAGYDIGRLLVASIARSGHLTRPAIRDGLERVKRMPAASGRPGTTMGFGPWDHGALKGDYLVLRAWRGGRTVQLA